MTVQNSLQYADQVAVPPVKRDAALSYGKLRVYQVQFTQSGVGSITSILRLIKLPPGKVALYGYASWLANSAMGASVTMSIGYAQYRLKDGTIQTASAAAINALTSMTAAGILQLGRALDATTGGTFTFESMSGVTIIGTIAGAVIPAAATVNGVIVVGVE